jgi:hypothetical protein
MNLFESCAAGAANRGSLSRGRALRRLAVTLVCVVTLVASAGTAIASEKGDMAQEAGLGLGAVLVSLVYGPVKVVYAACGAVVGGLAFLFSGGDADVAGVIMTPSVRGDYVLTPSHLRGEREIEFLGRAPEARRDADRVAQAPEASW